MKPVNPAADWRSAFKGRFIQGPELSTAVNGWTGTVERIEIHELSTTDDDGGKEESRERPVLYFTAGSFKTGDNSRGIVVNKTNGTCLAAMFGTTFGDWIGKRVTWVAEQVRVGARTEVGIRIKGSPDLAGPITVKIEMPKRKPLSRTLVRTGAPGGVSAPASEAPADSRPPREPGEEG
jgi:hypothetical protein